jgi:hypothetical protein
MAGARDNGPRDDQGLVPRALRRIDQEISRQGATTQSITHLSSFASSVRQMMLVGFDQLKGTGHGNCSCTMKLTRRSAG